MPENIREIILPSKTGTVDPTTVTPDFIGQVYVNTVTDTIFFAKSLATGDYEEIIDINSTVATQAHDQNSDTKLDDGQVNEVTSLDLRTHLDNLTKHRLINDGISTTTNLYSASQIDALIVASTSNLDIKNSVVTVADTNITLSGEQTINGVLTSASRIGVVSQTLSEENGIYITSSGAWTRATDADTDSEVTNGLSFFVSNSGSTKNGNQYILITADPIVLDTTPLTFIEVPRIVLGTTSGTATEGNDPRIPTQDENDALIGTNGTPSSINKYVTNTDIRLHTHANKTELDLITDGDHDVRIDNPHSVTKTQVGLSNVPNLDTTDAVNKAHDQNTDNILTTDGIIELFNAGVLKRNLLVDDTFNIQIDEIRARDIDGLKLNDDDGNGIFIEDGGQVGIGRLPIGVARLTVLDEINITTSVGTALGSFKANIPAGCVTIGSEQPTNFCMIVSGSERLRLNATNKQVTIGNSSPTVPELLTPLSLINTGTGNDIFFAIRDVAGTRLRIGQRLSGIPTNSISAEITTNTSGSLQLIARSDFDSDIKLFTGNPTPVERIRIDTNGNVGIGDILGGGDANSTLEVQGSFALEPLFISGTFNTQDKKSLYSIDTTGGASTVTIQTAHIVDGRMFIFKDESGNASMNKITIQTQGSETIDGQSTYILRVNFAWVKMYCRNGNLFIIG